MLMLDFLIFLIRRKYILLLNFIFVTIVAVLYSFFISKIEYCSQLTFLPPEENNSLPNSVLNLSISNLFSSSTSQSTDKIETAFNSKQTKRKIIEHFDFYKTFKLEKNANRFENAVKRLNKYVQLNSVEKGGMGFQDIVSFTIKCYHASPDTAYQMANYTFSLLDSIINRISIDMAYRNRKFIQDQLNFNKEKLDSLQFSFNEFKNRNKAYDIPEQLKLSLKTYADIKATSLLNEIKLQSLGQEFTGMTPEQDELNKTLQLYQHKLNQLEKSDSANILISFKRSSSLFSQYTNIIREIEIQNQLILLLHRELEQAKIKEANNTSSLIIIDQPYIPEYKARPKRIVLLLLILFTEHVFVFIILIYIYYYSRHMRNSSVILKIKNEFTRKH